MKFISWTENMWAFVVNMDMISGSEEWRERIRVADLTCVG